ncbi:MAG: lipopolysaccharide heptosyltransferase I [Rhodocyclaceae bacterium]|nr:lipopolysaccharide heptosyltransferase I [Rhodocyclaceae bacterium]MDZ4215952.1 lipopolysaccharide heptosyltransferase I [Rhodocyclaceae bacterium]
MRILLVKTSSLGDVIHNLPVASDILRRLPEAEIDWLVEESFAEVPRLHPAVGQIIPVAMRRWRKSLLSRATWREIGHYRRLVSADIYDAVIDTQGLVKSALLASPARGRKFGQDGNSAREPLAARFYDHCFAIPRNQNAVQRNRQLAAAALGYALDALPLDYGIAAPALQTNWLSPEKYAVLLTATSRADKEWPEDRWHTLGAALNDAGLHCVLPGGNATERARAARIAGSLRHAVAAPTMHLTDLAGLMAGAALIIGVDTGLVHLAAALQRPTVAIYCGSDPALTGVLGTAPHHNLGGIGQAPAPAEVIAAALQLAAA